MVNFEDFSVFRRIVLGNTGRTRRRGSAAPPPQRPGAGEAEPRKRKPVNTALSHSHPSRSLQGEREGRKPNRNGATRYPPHDPAHLKEGREKWGKKRGLDFRGSPHIRNRRGRKHSESVNGQIEGLGYLRSDGTQEKTQSLCLQPNLDNTQQDLECLPLS